MKKLIGFIAIALVGLQLNAQTSPEIAPPPAPLPPAPSAPTLKTTPVAIPQPTIAPVAVPAPQVITTAPVAPQPVVTTIVPTNETPGANTVIVYNDRGYNLSVIKIKGVDKVYIRNKSTTTYINLSTWNNRQDFYEKKYGTLPSLAPKL